MDVNFQHCSLVLLLSARDGHPFCAAYDLISARLGKSIGLRHRPLRVLLGGVRSRASIFLFALNSQGGMPLDCHDLRATLGELGGRNPTIIS